VNPVLVAMSHEPPEDVRFGRGEPAKLQPRSRVWRSAAPFIPSGHFFTGDKSKPKLKANASPEAQLCKALRDAGLTQSATIQRLSAFQHGSIEPRPAETIPPLPDWDIIRAPEGADTDAMLFEQAVEAITHQNSSEGRGTHHRRIGFFFQIEFDEDVALPMPSFGHSCHFGLGLFVPVSN
jgi:hypothetical protein